jgi:hypothetical protein
MLVVTVISAGCATDGRFRSVSITGGPCGDVSGYTVTGIAYADSKLVVVPVSRIRADTEWRFYLRPVTNPNDPDNYRDATVTIKGKFPATNPPPERNDWIDVAGSWSGTNTPGHYLVECVPETVTEGEEFEFLVDVEFVGELDPRAKVDN